MGRATAHAVFDHEVVLINELAHALAVAVFYFDQIAGASMKRFKNIPTYFEAYKTHRRWNRKCLDMSNN